MSEDLTDGIVIAAIGFIFLICIAVICFAAYEDGVLKDKCLMAGGVPVERLCVKPNSFIEVK